MAEDTGYPGGAWGVGATALGGGADIYAFIRQEQQRQQYQKLYDILSNPNKLAAYINRFNAPMSDAAVAATNRDLGANWATQTGGAPGGAMNQYTADAFAKLETQRQDSATQAALRALTGATGNIPGAPGMGNLNQILRSLYILRSIRGNQPKSGTPPGITQGGGPNADPLDVEAQQGSSYPPPTAVGVGPGAL